MINGFEDITYNLTDEEIKFALPLVIHELKKAVGEENSIKNSDIISRCFTCPIKLTPARVRKIINHIRITGKIRLLIGTSKGYYISNSIEKAEAYAESLKQRAREIFRVSGAIKKQIANIANADIATEQGNLI